MIYDLDPEMKRMEADLLVELYLTNGGSLDDTEDELVEYYAGADSTVSLYDFLDAVERKREDSGYNQ